MIWHYWQVNKNWLEYLMLLQFEKTETHLISFLVTLPYLRIGFVGVEAENETDSLRKLQCLRMKMF